MALYVTKNQEDIFSVVNQTIGDLNSTYTLLKSNPELSVSEVPIGLTVTYDPVFFQPPQVNSSAPKPEVTQQQYISRQNQTIYDVCLMTLTDLNKLYQLNFNNTITPPVPGTVFNFNTSNITDNILKKYTSDNNVVFATGFSVFTIRNGFLLRQDGGYLLRQDGGRFIRNGN